MSLIEEIRSMMGEELYNEVDALARKCNIPFAIAGTALVRVRNNRTAGMSQNDAFEDAYNYIKQYQAQGVHYERTN